VCYLGDGRQHATAHCARARKISRPGKENEARVASLVDDRFENGTY
jgi:hypothetical protein